jgi:hypothetical protein
VKAVRRESPVGQTDPEFLRLPPAFKWGSFIFVVILASLLGYSGWTELRSQDERNRLETERMKGPAYTEAKRKEAAEWEETRVAMYRLALEKGVPLTAEQLAVAKDSLNREVDAALAKGRVERDKQHAESVGKAPSDAVTRERTALNLSELSRDKSDSSQPSSALRELSTSSSSAVQGVSANWLLADQADRHRRTIEALTRARDRGDLTAATRILRSRSSELAQAIGIVKTGGYSVSDKRKMLDVLEQEKDWADSSATALSR